MVVQRKCLLLLGLLLLPATAAAAGLRRGAPGLGAGLSGLAKDADDMEEAASGEKVALARAEAQAKIRANLDRLSSKGATHGDDKLSNLAQDEDALAEEAATASAQESSHSEAAQKPSDSAKKDDDGFDPSVKAKLASLDDTIDDMHRERAQEELESNSKLSQWANTKTEPAPSVPDTSEKKPKTRESLAVGISQDAANLAVHSLDHLSEQFDQKVSVAKSEEEGTPAKAGNSDEDLKARIDETSPLTVEADKLSAYEASIPSIESVKENKETLDDMEDRTSSLRKVAQRFEGRGVSIDDTPKEKPEVIRESWKNMASRLSTEEAIGGLN